MLYIQLPYKQYEQFKVQEQTITETQRSEVYDWKEFMEEFQVRENIQGKNFFLPSTI